MSKTDRITRDSVPGDPKKIVDQYGDELEEWKDRGGTLAAVATALEDIATDEGDE